MGIFAIKKNILMRADGTPTTGGLANSASAKTQNVFQKTRHPRKGLPPVELDFIIY